MRWGYGIIVSATSCWQRISLLDIRRYRDTRKIYSKKTLFYKKHLYKNMTENSFS